MKFRNLDHNMQQVCAQKHMYDPWAHRHRHTHTLRHSFSNTLIDFTSQYHTTNKSLLHQQDAVFLLELKRGCILTC